jgi:hypothetical protein
VTAAPRYVRSRRGTVHRADCLIALAIEMTPWNWAAGRTAEQIVADGAALGLSYAFCAACFPDLPEGGHRPRRRRVSA